MSCEYLLADFIVVVTRQSMLAKSKWCMHADAQNLLFSVSLLSHSLYRACLLYTSDAADE